MTTVLLEGYLGEKFGREWVLNVGSAAQALYHIDKLKGGLREVLAEDAWEYEVTRDGHGYLSDGADLGMNTDGKTVRITPIVAGSKSGLIGIIAGVVLIVAGIFTFGGSVPLGAALLAGQAGLSGVLIGLGAAMILSGLASLIAGNPKLDTGNGGKKQSSTTIGGTINSVESGAPVPLAYGHVFTGSVVVSANITTGDVVAPGQPTGGSTGGGGAGPTWISTVHEL